MDNKIIKWRGHTLKKGSWRGPDALHCVVDEYGVYVVTWPNGKRWEASVDLGWGNSGRDGRGFGKTPQSAIDSAVRAALRNKRSEIAALEAISA